MLKILKEFWKAEEKRLYALTQTKELDEMTLWVANVFYQKATHIVRRLQEMEDGFRFGNPFQITISKYIVKEFKLNEDFYPHCIY